MKIYYLPVEARFQPTQKVAYPIHHDDYGVEQDFLDYIHNHQDLITTNISAADWLYLPIFWTRWHVQHNYGREGGTELQSYVAKYVGHRQNVFTICQYDDGPLVNIPGLKVFASARKNDSAIDIPLLSRSHRRPLFGPRKRYLASFVGRLATHPIREEMARFFGGNDDIKIVNTDQDEHTFVSTMLASYAALCPRGYGGNSFRFYEAMQLGIVPILIGDRDTRPFKKYVDWDHCSFYATSPTEVQNFLESKTTAELMAMGRDAHALYNAELTYGKWPKSALKILEDLHD